MFNFVMVIAVTIALFGGLVWAIIRRRDIAVNIILSIFAVGMCIVVGYNATCVYNAYQSYERLFAGEEISSTELSDMDRFFSGKTGLEWYDQEKYETVHPIWLIFEQLPKNVDKDVEIVYRQGSFYADGVKVDMGDTTSILVPTSVTAPATIAETGERISSEPGVAWDGPKD